MIGKFLNNPAQVICFYFQIPVIIDMPLFLYIAHLLSPSLPFTNNILLLCFNKVLNDLTPIFCCRAHFYRQKAFLFLPQCDQSNPPRSGFTS